MEVVEAWGEHLPVLLGAPIVTQGTALAASPGFDLVSAAGALNQWCIQLAGHVDATKLNDIMSIVSIGLPKDMMTALMSIKSVIETI
jgi:hypothetical protein